MKIQYIAVIAIMTLLMFAPSVKADFTVDQVINCPTCGDPNIDWERYRNAAIQECFGEFDGPSRRLNPYPSLFPFFEDTTEAEAAVIAYGDVAEDVFIPRGFSCTDMLEFNAHYNNERRIHTVVCGNNEYNNGSGCIPITIRYVPKTLTGSVGVSAGGFGLTMPTPSVRVGIDFLLVLARPPSGEPQVTPYEDINSDGYFQGPLPSVDPAVFPYDDGGAPDDYDPNAGSNISPEPEPSPPPNPGPPLHPPHGNITVEHEYGAACNGGMYDN